MATRLTAKQERFVEEYLLDLNASAAYQRAGYRARGNSAEASASKLLRNHKVAARIAELRAERSERTKVTADMVVAELARIGFSNMVRFASWGESGVRLKSSDELEEADAACVAQVQATKTTSQDRYGNTVETENTTFRLHDKPGALNSLGKHLGIFVERREVTGKNGGPIENEVEQKPRRSTAAEVREIDRHIADLDAEIALLEAESPQAGGPQEKA